MAQRKRVTGEEREKNFSKRFPENELFFSLQGKGGIAYLGGRTNRRPGDRKISLLGVKGEKAILISVRESGFGDVPNWG